MDERTENTQAVSAIRRRSLVVLLGFVAVVTAKVALVRWMVVGGAGLTGLLVDAMFVTAIFVLVDLFFADMRFRAMLITDLILSVLLLAVAAYASYYQALPTREALMAIGQAESVSSGIARLLSPAYLLLFADIPLLAAWVTRARRRGIDPLTGNPPGALAIPGLRTPYVYQWRAVYAAGAIALIVFAVSVRTVQSVPSAGSNGLAVSRTRGLSTYVTAELLGHTKRASATEVDSAASLQAKIDELRGNAGRDHVAGFKPGSAKGKNVIVIQVESLQAAAIGAKMGGVEVTPNLNRLIATSWYFPNHFSMVGRGTTADSEFAANTSLYPPEQGAASLMYADRVLPSLPRTLAGQGYAAYTFHTNTAEYWNRTQLYPAIGFTGYFDRSYFGSDEKIGMGSSDRVLFDKTMIELRALEASGTPYYAQVLTLSSHFPFVSVPASERTLAVAEPSVGTIEGDYLTEINYADRQIGAFVDQLQTSGMLDDAVLVIYGDHFGLPEARNEKEAQAIRALLGRDMTPVDRLNTPLIIHLPGQTEAHRQSTAVSELDVAPSIADALGTDLSDAPQFGQSVFASGPRLFAAGGLLPVGSYVDDAVLGVSDSTSGKPSTWSLSSRQQVSETAEAESERARVGKLLELSAAYVKSLPARGDFDARAKVITP